MEAKESEVQALLRDSKTSRVKELEAENEELRKETVRLRNCLEKALEVGESSGEWAKAIRRLQEDNVEMASVIKEQSERLAREARKAHQVGSQVQRLKTEN